MPNPLSKVQELVLNAKSILIVTHESPTFDSLGASLSMYLGFVSLGKTVTIACPDDIKVEMSNFIGVNKIVQNTAKRNFVISLDYTEGSIEKVSYNIQGDKFNLVVETREGFEPFSPDKVSYTQAGSAVDLIVAVDTIHLGGLKKLYEEQKEVFAGKPLINIDHHANNAQFGTLNLVNPMASTTSELVAELLSGIGVKLTIDIATNLLNGIYGATNGFQNPVISPRAYEVAAVCVRAGAKRFSIPTPVAMESTPGISDQPRTDQLPTSTNQPTQPAVSMPMYSFPQRHQSPTGTVPLARQGAGTDQPSSAPQVPVPSPDHPQVSSTYDKTDQSSDAREKVTQNQNIPGNLPAKDQASQRSDSAPDDWLKPKIFKSKDVKN